MKQNPVTNRTYRRVQDHEVQSGIKECSALQWTYKGRFVILAIKTLPDL